MQLAPPIRLQHDEAINARANRGILSSLRRHHSLGKRASRRLRNHLLMASEATVNITTRRILFRTKTSGKQKKHKEKELVEICRKAVGVAISCQQPIAASLLMNSWWVNVDHTKAYISFYISNWTPCNKRPNNTLSSTLAHNIGLNIFIDGPMNTMIDVINLGCGEYW